jgi:hypothetical protein
MIRKTGVALREDDREDLYCFIDSYMADSLHTVVERDRVLPNVVYKVSIPMTDANWVRYNQVLAISGFANGVHDMLAVGSDVFDQYTYVINRTSAEHAEGWKVLARSSERNLDIKRFRKSWYRSGRVCGLRVDLAMPVWRWIMCSKVGEG